jgi:N-acetylglucosaminyldiphosphoundecaprenol N-acetyl-beta-D-mannosaminyltransferase
VTTVANDVGDRSHKTRRKTWVTQTTVPLPVVPMQGTAPAAESTSRPRRRVFGLALDALTLDQTVQRCLDAIADGTLIEVGVVNAAKIVNMRRDERLHEAVAGCHVIVADGQSVVWASRMLGAALPERVAGIDLFQRLLEEAERGGRSVYFLGARQEVLDEMTARIAERLPGLRIAGAQHGYFSADDAPAIADAIKASGADMLFLGMTSPKKENFVAEFGRRTGAKVVHGVGGSFDVLAGVVKRAPKAWQRVGCEWLYRAIQEPRRLGKRYLTTNVAFAALVVRERLRPTAVIAEKG